MVKASKQSTLLNEIKQGKELANQLKKHINKASKENCKFLLEKLLSSYEKSLSLLNFNDLIEQELQSRTECSKDIVKMRNVKLSKQTEVCLVQKDQLEDGFTWRKYGQKVILGANYPRAYYRCSYRHTQGCLATKQVQKSDEEISTFEIKYRGTHSCTRTSHFSSSLEQESPQPNSTQIQEQQQNYQNTLESQLIYPFSFQVENQVFSPWQMNCFEMLNQNFHGSDSGFTDIISAPTSVTDSPADEFDFSVDEFDFSVDQVDFGANFPFNIQEIFS